MLNDKYTFENCSLGNGTKKRSLSLILVYDKFILVDYKCKESIIRNTALSYKDVEKIIGDSTGGNIYNLWYFTSKLKKNNELRATEMVEYYMLLYNNFVAKELYKYDHNTILRTHRINNSINNSDDCVNNDILEQYLYRLQQNAAKYEVNPLDTWHQDLSMELYTHATSPIRRYVDIINQKNIINLLEGKNLIVETPDKIDSINIFQKSLRKFYNNYKKLLLIFELDDSSQYDAFIIGINNLYVNIYIPEIDINHSFQLISKKLLTSNNIESTKDYIIINSTKLELYQQIKIKLTPLKYELNFNRKINIELIEPSIDLF